MTGYGLGARFGRCRAISVYALALCLAGLAWAQIPQVSDTAILGHLNAAISWYRNIISIDQGAGQPSDALYLTNARSQAAQAIQLAFEAAQNAASLRNAVGGSAPESAGNDNDQSTDAQNLANVVKSASDRVEQVQQQIADLEKEISKARGKKRETLLTQRDALQAELELDKAVQDSLQKIAGFINSSESTSSGLQGKINELKQSVPEAFATAARDGSKPPAGGQTSKATAANSSGLISQAAYLFSQMHDIDDVNELISETGRLRDNATQFQAPLRNALKRLVQQGREAASQAANDDPSQVAATRKNLQVLTAEFKQMSGVAVPLRQEIVSLDQCKGDLEQWRNSMLHEYGQVLRSLLMRVFGILIALAVVLGISALWTRAAFRYVHDLRRRRQLLLVRRFVTGFLVFVVLVLGFISEFSSLATFAGFITAGIAVALQTVILSVAAYFSLIGRYGVKVGDRVTISGVTGDVLDIGLVRLHVMEFAGTGVDLYPTGRVVVFSNSVLLSSTPLYKQLPGAGYSWHEVSMSLAPGTDPVLAEKVLLAAVNAVYAKYRQSIERQYAVMQRSIDSPVPAPEVQGKMQFSDKGLEFVVRYPVELRRTVDVDDQVTRELMRAITTTPELKTAGTPRLRAPIAA